MRVAINEHHPRDGRSDLDYMMYFYVHFSFSSTSGHGSHSRCKSCKRPLSPQHCHDLGDSWSILGLAMQAVTHFLTHERMA